MNNESILDFGKYEGKSISQIYYDEEDYGYIIWLHENSICNIPKEILVNSYFNCNIFNYIDTNYLGY